MTGRLLYIPGMLLLLLTAVPLLGAQSAHDIEVLFDEAKQAYDAGEMDQAIARYEDILAQNQYSSALFFNLANAYFRAGKAGEALLYYRRAEILSPRDPDIQANRDYAMKHKGLEAPETPFFLRFFSKFTFGQWAGLATATYWAGAMLVCVWLFHRKRLPGGWPRTTAVLVILLLLGGVGLWRTGAAVFGTEAVVLAENQPALYAPLENSTPHFSLPEGSLVRVVEESNGWMKIASGKDTGWIPAASCRVVYPW